jgi:hypothetical protein
MCGNLVMYSTVGLANDNKGETVWPNPQEWMPDMIGGLLPLNCEIKPRNWHEAHEMGNLP